MEYSRILKAEKGGKLKRCNKLHLLLVIVSFFLPVKTSLAVTPSSPSTEKEVNEAGKLYLFAEELYQTGQYYRALTEYQRFNSYYPNHEMNENVMFKIGLCYFRGKKYREGARAFEGMNHHYPDTPLGKEALLMAGECYRKQELITIAIEKFSQLTENSIMEETTVKAFYALGVLYAEIGKPEEAKENFKKLKENSAYIDLSKRLTEEVDQYRATKKKNPTAAGILAIIPGLGHLYCERPGDALVSFLVNGLFIWGTVESFRQEQYVLGGILAFFESGWYMGNIYSAVGSAYKYNRYQDKMLLEELEKNIDLTAPTSPSSPTLTLSFDIPF